MLCAHCFSYCKCRRMQRNSGSYRTGVPLQKAGRWGGTFSFVVWSLWGKEAQAVRRSDQSGSGQPLKTTLFSVTVSSDNNISQYWDFENEFAAPQWWVKHHQKVWQRPAYPAQSGENGSCSQRRKIANMHPRMHCHHKPGKLSTKSLSSTNNVPANFLLKDSVPVANWLH